MPKRGSALFRALYAWKVLIIRGWSKPTALFSPPQMIPRVRLSSPTLQQDYEIKEDPLEAGEYQFYIYEKTCHI